MKKSVNKSIILMPFMVLCSLLVDAQTTPGFHYGGRFGIGESILRVDQVSGEDTKLFITGGLSTNFQFNRFLGISADFMVASKGGMIRGYKTDGAFNRDYYYDDKFSLNYVEIPLMFKFSLPLGEEFAIRAYTGPSFNFLVGGYQTRVYDDGNYNENNGFYANSVSGLKTSESTWVMGVGVDIMTPNGTSFFLDLRTSSPTSSAGRIYNQQAYNSYYMLSIGYLF